jgi:hypothetical protein
MSKTTNKFSPEVRAAFIDDHREAHDPAIDSETVETLPVLGRPASRGGRWAAM